MLPYRNYDKWHRNAKINFEAAKWVGTVLSNRNGYLIAGMLLVILIVLFVFLFIKNSREEKQTDSTATIKSID